MSAPSPSWPSSRELAELWPHFHPWQPNAVWLGLLLLHRIEAPVLVSESLALDPLALHVLTMIPDHRIVTWDELHTGMALPTGLLRGILAELTRHGCLQANSANHWSLTDTGVRSRTDKQLFVRKSERRVFHFCDGIRDGVPAFVRWQSGAGQVSIPAPKTQWSVTPSVLQECVSAPTSWKTAHHFPTDIDSLAWRAEQDGMVSVNDEQVMLHHVVRLPVAIILGRHCLGFALTLPSWHLSHHPPLFHSSTLAETAHFIGADLSPPPISAWAEAWDMTRRPLGLPHGEVQAFEATAQGPRVVIRMPAANLRKKPLPASETWLLVGMGPFRCAARAEFHEDPAAT